MNPLRGISLKVASVVAFILMATCIKAAASQVPPGQSVFFRSFFALPVLVTWLAWKGELRNGFATQDLMGQMWRGVIGTAAMGLGFTALGLLPLPEATAISYTAPLLTVIFAAMFLGERIRAFRIIAVVIGLIGVVIVLAPRLTVASAEEASALKAMGAMAAVLGAVCAALAHVFIRKLVHTETTSSIVFYHSVFGSALALVTLPFGWAMPDTAGFALLIGAGLLGGVGQILLTAAYREAEVSVIAPFDYVSMLFAIGLGYALFHEVPTLTMLSGAALIIAAGIVIIWRERQLGIQRAAARRVLTPQG